MFQFKNAGLGMKEPDTSNALPNTFGKVRTFKEDLENFEKGVTAEDAAEEISVSPTASSKISNEAPPQKQELPSPKASAAPADVNAPDNPFQSVPTPQPVSSSSPITSSDTQQLPPFKSSPSQSFFAEKPASAENFPPKTENQSEQPAPQKNKRSFILPLIIVLLLVIAGAGFYYYWFNIKNSPSNPPSTPTTSAPQTVPPTAPNPDSSQNKNLRNIVVDSSSPSGIRDAIQKFATDFVSSASEGDLVEAKLSDKSNKPISKDNFFTEFLGLGGIAPNGVTMKLSEDYSLFARKESGSVRLGFVFKTVTSSGLADEMKNWEPTLETDLIPLYLDQTPTGTGAFSSSQYKNADIRYFNFSSPTDTSLDYSIISNFLVIGSSKNTARAILDYMSQK